MEKRFPEHSKELTLWLGEHDFSPIDSKSNKLWGMLGNRSGSSNDMNSLFLTKYFYPWTANEIYFLSFIIRLTS